MDHKKCPICCVEKPVSEYYKYFSKERQKYRISNYCISCGRENARPRAEKHYKENTDTKKQYAKDYRVQNKDKVKVLAQKFKIKYREELKDCYVRDLLTQKNKIPKTVMAEIPEIVETKRLQIKIKRKLKQLKNGKK